MISVKQIADGIKLVFFVSILSQFGLSGSVGAATQKLVNSKGSGPNFVKMSTSSEQVVLAQVKSTSARWVGKVIVTTAELEPLEMIKGVNKSGALVVSFIGGRVGNIQQTLSHPLSLNEGETAVLFLKDADRKGPLAGTKLFSHFDGKVPLLKRGESVSRLETNDRLSSLINNLRTQVQQGE